MDLSDLMKLSMSQVREFNRFIYMYMFSYTYSIKRHHDVASSALDDYRRTNKTNLYKKQSDLICLRLPLMSKQSRRSDVHSRDVDSSSLCRRIELSFPY